MAPQPNCRHEDQQALRTAVLRRDDDAPSTTAGGGAWRTFSSAIRAATGTGRSGSARSWRSSAIIARVHEWEISAGGDIVAWMEERLDDADHVLCVISSAYLTKDYSSWERQSGQWDAVSHRSNFVLPVFVEDCEAPRLLAPLKRCELSGIGEDEAQARLAALSGAGGKADGTGTFSRRNQAAQRPPRGRRQFHSPAGSSPCRTSRSASRAISLAATTSSRRSTPR